LPAGSTAVADDEVAVGDEVPETAAVVPVLEDVLVPVWPVELDDVVGVDVLLGVEGAGAVAGVVEPPDPLEWCEPELGFCPPRGSMYC
jgi:hypothetical protein